MQTWVVYQLIYHSDFTDHGIKSHPKFGRYQVQENLILYLLLFVIFRKLFLYLRMQTGLV